MTTETFQEFKDRILNEPRYFDRQGKPLTLMEWGEKCEDYDYKVIKHDYVDRYFVSTVWIGLNMNLFGGLPPQIFETMIFIQDESLKDKDDPLEHFQERYFTEEQAIQGHEEALAICRAQILIDVRNQDND